MSFSTVLILILQLAAPVGVLAFSSADCSACCGGANGWASIRCRLLSIDIYGDHAEMIIFVHLKQQKQSEAFATMSQRNTFAGIVTFAQSNICTNDICAK
jgi:hypothetical protein